MSYIVVLTVHIVVLWQDIMYEKKNTKIYVLTLV